MTDVKPRLARKSAGNIAKVCIPQFEIKANETEKTTEQTVKTSEGSEPPATISFGTKKIYRAEKVLPGKTSPRSATPQPRAKTNPKKTRRKRRATLADLRCIDILKPIPEADEEYDGTFAAHQLDYCTRKLSLSEGDAINTIADRSIDTDWLHAGDESEWSNSTTMHQEQKCFLGGQERDLFDKHSLTINECIPAVSTSDNEDEETSLSCFTDDSEDDSEAHELKEAFTSYELSYNVEEDENARILERLEKNFNRERRKTAPIDNLSVSTSEYNMESDELQSPVERSDCKEENNHAELAENGQRFVGKQCFAPEKHADQSRNLTGKEDETKPSSNVIASRILRRRSTTCLLSRDSYRTLTSSQQNHTNEFPIKQTDTEVKKRQIDEPQSALGSNVKSPANESAKNLVSELKDKVKATLRRRNSIASTKPWTGTLELALRSSFDSLYKNTGDEQVMSNGSMSVFMDDILQQTTKEQESQKHSKTQTAKPGNNNYSLQNGSSTPQSTEGENTKQTTHSTTINMQSNGRSLSTGNRNTTINPQSKSSSLAKTKEAQPVNRKSSLPKTKEAQPVNRKSSLPKTKEAQPVNLKSSLPKTKEAQPVNRTSSLPKTKEAQPVNRTSSSPKTKEAQPVNRKSSLPKTKEAQPVNRTPSRKLVTREETSPRQRPSSPSLVEKTEKQAANNEPANPNNKSAVNGLPSLQKLPSKPSPTTKASQSQNTSTRPTTQRNVINATNDRPDERKALVNDRPDERKTLVNDRPDERKALVNDRPDERKALVNDRPDERKTLVNDRPDERKALVNDRPDERKALVNDRPDERKALVNDRPDERKALVNDRPDERKTLVNVMLRSQSPRTISISYSPRKQIELDQQSGTKTSNFGNQFVPFNVMTKTDNQTDHNMQISQDTTDNDLEKELDHFSTILGKLESSSLSATSLSEPEAVATMATSIQSIYTEQRFAALSERYNAIISKFGNGNKTPTASSNTRRTDNKVTLESTEIPEIASVTGDINSVIDSSPQIHEQSITTFNLHENVTESISCTTLTTASTSCTTLTTASTSCTTLTTASTSCTTSSTATITSPLQSNAVLLLAQPASPSLYASQNDHQKTELPPISTTEKERPSTLQIVRDKHIDKVLQDNMDDHIAFVSDRTTKQHGAEIETRPDESSLSTPTNSLLSGGRKSYFVSSSETGKMSFSTSQVNSSEKICSKELSHFNWGATVIASLIHRKLAPRRKTSIVPTAAIRKSKVFNDVDAGMQGVPLTTEQFNRCRSYIEKITLKAVLKTEVSLIPKLPGLQRGYKLSQFVLLYFYFYFHCFRLYLFTMF